MADERAGAVRGVQLVPGQRQVVDAVARHVDRGMRRQLSGIDEQTSAVRVGDLGDLGERPDLAGHVARAGGRHEVRVVAVRQVTQGGCQRLEQLGRRLGHGQVSHPDALPRQQVGVVLTGEGDDVGARGKRSRQQVDRVGRVAGDDHRVVGPGIHELPDRLPRAFVGGGCGAGLEARPAVDARVPAQQLLDGVMDALEGGGGGGVVEVDVAGRRRR